MAATTQTATTLTKWIKSWPDGVNQPFQYELTLGLVTAVVHCPDRDEKWHAQAWHRTKPALKHLGTYYGGQPGFDTATEAMRFAEQYAHNCLLKPKPTPKCGSRSSASINVQQSR